MKRGLKDKKQKNKNVTVTHSTTKNSNVIKSVVEYKLGNSVNIYYKVNEICKLTGLSRQQVHNYTQLGLIREAYRSKSGHRFYTKETIDRIFLIEMLKRHRTLKEVKEIIQDKYDTQK